MKIKLVKEYVAAIKDVDEEERTITAIVSTGEKDRMGEYIPPEEWKLANYEKNPVILWAHNYDQPPVAKALWTKADKKGLLQKIKFAKTDFASDIYGLYKDGFLNAFSVGFQADRDSENSNIFRNAELLEVSCVPVPCNANALAERAASGMIKSPEGLAFVKSLEVKTEVINKPEPEEEKEEDKAKKQEEENAKAIAEINEKFEREIANLKEGRVLSKRNRDLIKSAVDALGALLAATDPDAEEEDEEEKGKSIDKRGKFVIIKDKQENKDAPQSEISAETVRNAIKSIDISGIVRREIRRAKGEVD